MLDVLPGLKSREHVKPATPATGATAKTLFQAAGYSSNELYAFDYDYNQDLERSAAQLKTYVDNVRAQTGASKVDIVNHSMGGLVTRWYMQKLGGSGFVSHVASLAGANHGTTYATACVIYNACVDMLPGSSFINQLTGDETPGSGKYATWYSPCDGVIIPYTSTMLSGADNNYVACQNHILFLTDALVLADVRQFFAT